MNEVSSNCHQPAMEAPREPFRVFGASKVAVSILIIEDEELLLAFIRRGLRAEGYAADGARDGETGLARALAGGYKLVILDLLIPGMDGLSVLKALRLTRPGLPVLILSARDDLPTKLLGFELGANDYVTKPFSFDELLARVRALLRHASPWTEGLRAGELVLDLQHREARIGSVTCALSERELGLLRYLVEHPGETVSRERLLSEVWGYTFDPGSNIVDVYVGRLRRKLRAPAAIETVRHAGYRLVAA
jgi:DNA-binding response OmpR family regulator